MRLREALESGRLVVAVGAHDGMTARLGEQAGFDVIWGSGFEVATSYGVPDGSLLGMAEQLRQCEIMAAACTIPVIADCDTGFGNAINAAVATRRFESAGVAAICIEDNIFPKRCSFYGDVRRSLVRAEEHALKVRACKDAQSNPDFMVIARTEALIVGESMRSALDRAERYADAGADAVLVHSKRQDADEMLAFAALWDGRVPLVAVPTTYDDVSASDLHGAGYGVVIFANHGIRTALFALRAALRTLRATGRGSALRSSMATLDEVFDLVDVAGLRAAERKYLPGGDDGGH